MLCWHDKRGALGVLDEYQVLSETFCYIEEARLTLSDGLFSFFTDITSEMYQY